jgi:hypothetical protein
LGNNGATADNRDGQTAYLTAENLGVKVTGGFQTLDSVAEEDWVVIR